MPKAKVAAGQIWRQDASGVHYLITRVYNELFDQYAILRRVEGEETMRIKVRGGDPQHPLPGFTQESGEFHLDDAASGGGDRS